ncbi:hypothetical protein [Tateyamaria pelophila]|uniref:hypothetical protein n=1 Tax=Tateyamaria pelophila TaxID=328415 RepID=UPI001CBD0D94|nr:hypothetical protein [Tateyamaria pelophila]
MSNTDRPETATHADVTDRPSPVTPSVDRPWDSLKEVLRRVDVRKGDRATHRAYHSLYEDMLN